jgi:integrase
MAYYEKRTGKKGVTWRVRITVKGAPPQSESFRRKVDAQEWAAKTEAALRDGQLLPDRRERDRTVADLAAEYRAVTIPAYLPVERRKRASRLNWWEEQLGHRRLVDLKGPDFSDALRKLAAGAGPSGEPVGPATQVRYLAVIRHAFSVAISDWGWLPHNPAGHVRTPREPRGRVRYLSNDERKSLLATCQESQDRRLYPIVVVALSTGARQGELMALRWPEVDLVRAQAVVDGKNGERRALALSDQAIAVFRDMGKVRSLHTDLVFATVDGRARFPREIWNKVVADAKVKNFRFHDLRHTFASYLAMSGATLPELAAALGHKTLAMVQRYAHLAPAHTAGVVRRMTEKFLS